MQSDSNHIRTLKATCLLNVSSTKSNAYPYYLSSAVILLDTARKVLPFVVTVSGRVGSDTPIKCEHSGLRGVIVEETVHASFLSI